MKSPLVGSFILVALIFTNQNAASADSGLQPGDPLGAFHVVKAAGAIEDGVEVGDKICYRCKYGGSPMAMIFTRSTDAKVQELVKGLNDSAIKHRDDRFRTLVVLLGDDPDALQTSAANFLSPADADQTPIVIPIDSKTGPLAYRIDEGDEVTIVLAQNSQIDKVLTGSANDFSVEVLTKDIDEMLRQ